MSAVTNKKPSSDPGYLMTTSYGGSEYQVFIYIRDAQGNKTYLPSDCAVIDKIRGLTSGLLNAHDARRTSAKENPYVLSGINSKGLIKKNNTLISHDFLIQPVSVLVADQMASSVSSPGNPIDASAIKAKDVWSALEGTFRHELGRPANPQPLEEEQPSQQISTPAQPGETPQPAQQPPQPAPTTQTPPPVQQTTPPANPSPSQPATKPQTQPPKSNPPLNPDNLLVLHGPDVTASELNLRGYDFGQPDWYEKMPDRIKLRIITDILAVQCHRGGIYEKVWKIFETRANKDPSTTIIDLLEKEQKQLSLRCRALPSAIPLPVRVEATQIIDAYHHHLEEMELQEKIVSLMEKEIALKEQLFQCIREQASAEGVAIEDGAAIGLSIIA